MERMHGTAHSEVASHSPVARTGPSAEIGVKLLWKTCVNSWGVPASNAHYLFSYAQFDL